MLYSREDMDFIRLLLNDFGKAPFYPDKAISEALDQTRMFHYIYAQKVLGVTDGTTFNFDLPNINEKLDAIIKQLEEEK